MIVMKLLPALHPKGEPEPHWQYLRDYDLEADEGRGNFVLTDDVSQAMRFPSQAMALRVWGRRSTTVPTRPDGHPNKPMTAYHATFEAVP